MKYLIFLLGMLTLTGCAALDLAESLGIYDVSERIVEEAAEIADEACETPESAQEYIDRFNLETTTATGSLDCGDSEG